MSAVLTLCWGFGTLESGEWLASLSIGLVIFRVIGRYYRPIGFREVEAYTISRQSAHGRGKVNPTHRPPLPLLLVSAIVLSRSQSHWRSGRWSQWKIAVTPWGMEPSTSWLVEHCLNQLHHLPPLRPSGCTEIDLVHYVLYWLHLEFVELGELRKLHPAVQVWPMPSRDCWLAR